jgi:hypothetical protein
LVAELSYSSFESSNKYLILYLVDIPGFLVVILG